MDIHDKLHHIKVGFASELQKTAVISAALAPIASAGGAILNAIGPSTLAAAGPALKNFATTAGKDIAVGVGTNLIMNYINKRNQAPPPIEQNPQAHGFSGM